MKNLKVLMLNGSPHANGNTAVALREMEEIFKASGVEVETVLIGNQAVRGCTACGACGKLGKCVFDDVVNELKPKFEEADGLVVASPVYYASANATLIACLDRRGGAGRRGPADDAHARAQHDVFDEEYRARQGAVRPA